MYSLDRRVVAKQLYSYFYSLRKTALILQVSHSTVSRWLNHPQRKQYVRKTEKLKSSVIIETIRISIQMDPFISVCKLRSLILESLNIVVSRELIRTCIFKLGMSRKKARFFGSPKDLETKTQVFLNQRDKFVNENRLFFSLDETSFGRQGRQIMGYSAIGKQLRICKSKPRMTTVSSLVIASKDKIWNRKEVVGSFNTDLFLDFLNNLYIPEASVILLDNVAFHHSKRVKNWALSRNIELLYVPPYSPWFNPIEGIFSIVKRSFYKHGNINQSFNDVTTSHCKAFFDKSFKEKDLRI